MSNFINRVIIILQAQKLIALRTGSNSLVPKIPKNRTNTSKLDETSIFFGLFPFFDMFGLILKPAPRAFRRKKIIQVIILRNPAFEGRVY